MASVSEGTTPTTKPTTAPRPAPIPREGLAWLGRQPEARASVLLRVLIGLGRFVAFRICALQLRVEGMEHQPGGAHFLACAVHRSWIDAPLLVGVFPASPRIWYLGSGVATFRGHWRERFMRRVGGILPVYRGGLDVGVHVNSARAVLDAGAVFGIFPEGTRAGEPGETKPFRRGVGLIGLRTGAPILPVALAGTKELYRGRRIALRCLPPVTALELAGIAKAPPIGSAAELDAARRATIALRELLAPHVAELSAWTQDPPERPRRWRWLTSLMK